MKKCKDCWKDRGHNNPLISRCKECTYKASTKNKNQKSIYTLKRTPIKRVWKKKLERLKNNGSEVLTYEKKFNNCDKRCVICKKEFKTFEETKTWCYAHILNKRDWPHIRNFINNIAFVCSIEHHEEVDKQISGQNKKELEQKILNGEEIIFESIAYLD